MKWRTEQYQGLPIMVSELKMGGWIATLPSKWVFVGEFESAEAAFDAAKKYIDEKFQES